MSLLETESDGVPEEGMSRKSKKWIGERRERKEGRERERRREINIAYIPKEKPSWPPP